MSAATIDPDTATAVLTDEAPRLQEAGPAWFDGMTLDALGFGATTLKGPGVDSASYSVDLPLGSTAGSMRVRVVASATLDGPGWTPGLDVYVNGRVAGNVPLDTSVETSTIDVPTELLRPGSNFVRLQADFGRGSTNCVAPTPPAHQINIVGSTSIRLERDDTIDAELADVPYLLRSFADTTTAAVITPSEPSIEEAERAVQLAVLFGGRGLALSVLTADEDITTPNTARHLVMFGTTDRQPRLAELAHLLPIGAVIPDRWPAEIENQLDGTGRSVSIQLTELADDDLLIAIIGAHDGDAIAGVELMVDSSLRQDLLGSAVIASTDPLGAYPVAYNGEPLAQPLPAGSTTLTSEVPTEEQPAEIATDLRTPDLAVQDVAVRTSDNRRNTLVIMVLGVAVIGVGGLVLRRVRAPGA
jgi:hypothetical protein